MAVMYTRGQELSCDTQPKLLRWTLYGAFKLIARDQLGESGYNVRHESR